MSWDVLLTNSAQKAGSNPEEAESLPFPAHEELIQAFKQVFPQIEDSEDGWATIDSPDYSMEVHFMKDKEGQTDSISLGIRAEKDPMPYIAQLCKTNGWEAYDTTMGDYINLDEPLKNGFSGWQSYRNQIVGTPSKPWWKFW